MNIIAFSLYGNCPLYVEGLIRRIPSWRLHYPDWEIFVYSSGYWSHHALLEQDVFLIPPPTWILSPPNWRLAAANTVADAVIFRDADSAPSHREAAAVAEWIESGLPVHVMRDNAHHRRLMLAGMWGCVPSKLPDLCPLFIEWQASNLHNPLGYGNDEDFLGEIVWPIAQQIGVMQHDRWQLFAGSKPFPGDNPDTLPEAFIGEKLYPDGTPVDPSYRPSRPEHFNA